MTATGLPRTRSFCTSRGRFGLIETGRHISFRRVLGSRRRQRDCRRASQSIYHESGYGSGLIGLSYCFSPCLGVSRSQDKKLCDDLADDIACRPISEIPLISPTPVWKAAAEIQFLLAHDQYQAFDASSALGGSSMLGVLPGNQAARRAAEAVTFSGRFSVHSQTVATRQPCMVSS